jgi:AcrR family transcriptional regulator
MPKISDARREERRAEIIEAAGRCFARKGLKSTSMADIIEESGLSAGAIYGYFAGKQELLEAVAASIITNRVAEIGLDEDGALAARSPRELALLVIEGFRTLDKLPFIIQTWGEAVTDPELRTIANRIIPEVRRLLIGSMTGWGSQHPSAVTGDLDEWADRTALVVIGIAQGFALQSVVFTGFSADDYVAAVADVLPG